MEPTLTHQMKEIQDSPLIGQFDEFYREVINCKKMILLSVPGNSGESGTCSIHPIFVSLLNILEKQAAEARTRGGEYGFAFYKDAQYAMAALGDEIFLNTDWDGKEEWKTNLLEFKLFGTYTAGQVIFQKIERCLGSHDPSYREIAAIYFLMLSLGFMGKYRGKADLSEADAYRSRLFAFVFQKQPEGFREGKLFPGAYESLIRSGEPEKLPRIRRWIGTVFAVIALLVAVSHTVWLYYIYDLDRMVDILINKLNLLVQTR